jgi:hypothetical protein
MNTDINGPFTFVIYIEPKNYEMRIVHINCDMKVHHCVSLKIVVALDHEN